MATNQEETYNGVRLHTPYVEVMRTTNFQTNFLLRGIGTNKQLKRLRAKSARLKGRYEQHVSEQRLYSSRSETQLRQPNTHESGARPITMSDTLLDGVDHCKAPVPSNTCPASNLSSMMHVRPSSLKFGDILAGSKRQRCTSSTAIVNDNHENETEEDVETSNKERLRAYRSTAHLPLSPLNRGNSRRLQLQRIASYTDTNGLKPLTDNYASMVISSNQKTVLITNCGLTSHNVTARLLKDDPRIRIRYQVSNTHEKLRLSPGITMKLRIQINGNGKPGRIRNTLEVIAGKYVHSIPITARLVARKALVKQVEHEMSARDRELVKQVPRVNQTYWNSKTQTLEWFTSKLSDSEYARAATAQSLGFAEKQQGPVLGHWFDPTLEFRAFKEKVVLQDGMFGKPMPEEDSLSPYCFVVHRQQRPSDNEEDTANSIPQFSPVHSGKSEGTQSNQVESNSGQEASKVDRDTSDGRDENNVDRNAVNRNERLKWQGKPKHAPVLDPQLRSYIARCRQLSSSAADVIGES